MIIGFLRCFADTQTNISQSISAVSSTFQIGETESEIIHSTDLSHADVDKILKFIIQGKVHYNSDLPEDHPMIDVKMIASIRISRIISAKPVLQIREKYRQPDVSSRFYAYDGYIEDERLIIVRAYGIHIN